MENGVKLHVKNLTKGRNGLSPLVALRKPYTLNTKPESCRHYVHLQTPGGTKNLMNPDYSLKV